MSLYARSDLMSVSIPPASGGCGDVHSRPVTRGNPAKIWKLDCNPCESYLRGDRKPRIIKVIPGDKDQGIPSRMEHVADADPHWSTTAEGIPSTPDEQHINKIRIENATQRLQELQALAAVRAAGINLPDDVAWLLERNHDPRIVKGEMVCPKGHGNAAGATFCAHCGTRMSVPALRAEIESPELTEAIPLPTLHIATLKKMARQRGLDDKGNKAQLIERLTT